MDRGAETLSPAERHPQKLVIIAGRRQPGRSAGYINLRRRLRRGSRVVITETLTSLPERLLSPKHQIDGIVSARFQNLLPRVRQQLFRRSGTEGNAGGLITREPEGSTPASRNPCGELEERTTLSLSRKLRSIPCSAKYSATLHVILMKSMPLPGGKSLSMGTPFALFTGTLAASVITLVPVGLENAVVAIVEAGEIQLDRLIRVGDGLLLANHVLQRFTLAFLRSSDENWSATARNAKTLPPLPTASEASKVK